MTKSSPTTGRRSARVPRVERSGRVVPVVLLGVAVVAALGVGAWAWYGQALSASQARFTGITVAVTRGNFIHEVVEPGEVESANNVDIRCEVQGGATVQWIVPEGTAVQPGMKLIQFEATALKQTETQQQITAEQARSTLIQAELAHATAKIAVQEYLNGLFKQELQTVESEIVLAEENLRRAQDYAKYSEKLARKGYVTSVQLEADQFAITNSQLALDSAKTKKKVLEDYTKAKTVKTLESEVGKAEAQMLAAQASLKLEEQKLQEVRDQIAKCVVVSPHAGTVVYANEMDRRGTPEVMITEGTMARFGQILIRLPDPNQMQVRAKVKEGRVGLVRPGQRVVVRVDAIRGIDLSGTVRKVDPIALPSWYTSVREYATYVTLDQTRLKEAKVDLRPAMTAEVAIIVNEAPDCLQLPVQAVVARQGKHWVCLPSPNGLTAQPIEVGENNEKTVVVKNGLDEGQLVALNANEYIRDLLGPPPESEKSGEATGEGTGGREGYPGAPGGRGPAGDVARGPGGPGAAAGPQGATAPGGPGGAGAARGNPAEMFSRADANGDGKISLGEAPEFLRSRFAEVDKNGDGNIDQAEMAARPRRAPGGTDAPGAPGTPAGSFGARPDGASGGVSAPAGGGS